MRLQPLKRTGTNPRSPKGASLISEHFPRLKVWASAMLEAFPTSSGYCWSAWRRSALLICPYSSSRSRASQGLLGAICKAELNQR